MAESARISTEATTFSQNASEVSGEVTPPEIPRIENPSAAIESVLASWSNDPLQAQSDLYETLENFTVEDFQNLTRDPHAFDVLTAPLENNFRAKRAFVDGMAARWLAVDEEAAFAWLATKPKVVRWGVPMGDFAVEAFARVRPEHMLTHVLSLPPSDDRRTMAAALIRTVGETDVKLAKEWIERFDDPGTRAAAERGYLEAMANLDPLSVFSLSETDTGLAWEAAATEAVRRGSQFAIAMAEKAHTTEQKMGIASLLSSSDPAAAAELIAEQAKTDPAAVLSSHVVPWTASVFARRDWNAAREWAEALPPELRADALARVMPVAVAADPRAAMDWLATRPPAEASETAAGVFSSWLKSDEATARAYATELPSGPSKDAMQAALLHHLCQNGRPSEAAALFADTTGPERGKLAAEIAMGIFRNDRASATAWAAALPAGKEQTMAINAIVDSLSGNDPVAVTNWIEQFPDGEVRDQAIRTCVNSVGSLDPGSASEWVLQIGDPWNRSMAAKKVFETMLDRDPASAIRWLTDVPGINETFRRTTLQDNQ